MTLRSRWRASDRFLVRHKDNAVLVVEKRAGVLSQRTDSGRGEDMLSLLREFVGAKGRTPGVLPVHRLDRDVSGLLVYARRPDVQQDLIAQFREHTVERRYLAAVRGVLEQDRGTFESWLVTDDPSLRVYSDVSGRNPNARRAVTHWRVLERFTRRRSTLVEVQLETGLRNQIRVQFAEAGHPLLGDRKYAEDDEQSEGGVGRRTGSRVFLHAAVLGFEHPIMDRAMRFEASLPPDLVRWRAALGGAAPRPARADAPPDETEAEVESEPRDAAPRSRPRARKDGPRSGRPQRARKKR